MSQENPAHARIDALVKSDKVVLFMKGTRGAPQCGFSATVVSILDQYVPEYTTVDVLADPEVRDGVKAYASWPTIPQLYVHGEFVGGCDIVRELDEGGELVGTLGDAARMPDPPTITISDAAAEVFKEAMAEADEGDALRLSVDPMFKHDLALDQARDSDLKVVSNGIAVIVDAGTARRANGLTIDYVKQPAEGFKMDNPNAPPQVKQVSPSEAKAIVDAGNGVRFIDVRTPAERATASIERTVLLDADSVEELQALPKDTPLVFHCHHGHRSYQAAIHFLEQGFTKVYNVVGGIEAWSAEVDPSVPRY
jgi:monothiol glutaredoxin